LGARTLKSLGKKFLIPANFAESRQELPGKTVIPAKACRRVL
jgi:hypothetical protein